MGFKTGLDEIDKAAEEAKARSEQRGAFGPRLTYRNFKDGDKLILRFLTDDIITAKFYDWVLTQRTSQKTGDVISQDFLVDPDGTDWVKHYGGIQKEYGTNKLIQAKPRTQTVAVAVVREEVPGKGRKLEVRDKEILVEVDGKKVKAREFVLIKQGISFWEQFRGMTRRYDTITDRDYEITRVGSDKDTHYEIAPLDPVEALRDLDALHAFYGYGRKWNEEDPDRFLYCPQTLDEWSDGYSGEERAKYWLVGDESTTTPVDTHEGHPVVDADGNGEFHHDTTSNPDEAQAAPKFGDFKQLVQPLSK
jgi:hypothetical protein